MNAATLKDIKQWFQNGMQQKASWMIIATDTYDYSDYPIYCQTETEARETIATAGKIMEVYDLHAPQEPQMAKRRNWALPTE